MVILRDTHLRTGGPAAAPQFPSDSVLGRMARGGYKPTDADVQELQKLAAGGNRAERRAAGRHLKKHGIAPAPAAPRAPIVLSADPPPVAAPQASKQSPAPKAPQEKRAAKEAVGEKAAPKKTTGKKAAAKKVAPTKAAPAKGAAKKAAVKKTAVKKAAAKKPPAKKPPAKAPRRK